MIYLNFMTFAAPRLERHAAAMLAGLLGGLSLYALWSAPGLANRWGASPAGLALLLSWATSAVVVACIALRATGRGGWIAIATLTIGLRLASLALVAGRESPSDPHWYLVLAQHLLAGQGLFLDDPAMGARVYAEFPPAYPVFLASWGAIFGLSPLSVLALSTLLDTITAVLIARLGCRIGEPRAGVAAATLYLIWPSVIMNAPLAQKESLELLLVLALVHGWLGASVFNWRQALAIGVPAGLLALTQPGMAALAALFGFAVAPRLGARRFVIYAAGGALVAIAVLVPWWIRNAYVLHAFVPLTSVGGLSLWVGENPAATGNWMPYPKSLVGLNELDNSKAAARLATDWMMHHPLEVVRLNIAKFLRAAGVGQFAVTRLDAMRPGLAPRMSAVLLPLTHGAQFLLLAASAASLLVCRRPLLTALMLAILAQCLLFGVWFEFAERHRELLTPFLLLSIAIALASLVPPPALSTRAQT